MRVGRQIEIELRGQITRLLRKDLRSSGRDSAMMLTTKMLKCDDDDVRTRKVSRKIHTIANIERRPLSSAKTMRTLLTILTFASLLTLGGSIAFDRQHHLVFGVRGG